MRKSLIPAFALLLITVPAHAGTFSLNGQGQIVWQPALCTAPVPPDGLLTADRETPANDMNQRARLYNDYAAQAQTYMDCVNSEAEQDSSIAAAAVIDAGRALINATQQNLQGMAASVKGGPQ